MKPRLRKKEHEFKKIFEDLFSSIVNEVIETIPFFMKRFYMQKNY